MNQPEQLRSRPTENRAPTAPAIPAPRPRLVVWFAVRGDLRFLSHRDAMEMWRRLLVRTRLPLHYTQGFNPRLRMTLPLPRSVGMAAEDDLLLAETTAAPPSSEVLAAIRAKCPADLHVHDIGFVHDSVSPQAIWARYRFLMFDAVDGCALRQRLQAFIAAERWLVQRPRRGRHPQREIDLKQTLRELELEKNCLTCRVDLAADLTPRIDEICRALDIEYPRAVRSLCRTEVAWPRPLRRVHNPN